MLERILIAVTALALALPVSAQKSFKATLGPTLRKKIRKDNISYNKCRKQVLQKLKARKGDRKNLRQDLKACNALFPNAAIYVECKAQVLKNFKKTPKRAREKLRICRDIQTASTYQPDSPVPFYQVSDRAFFAGVDLQNDMPPKVAQKLPNYDCSPLEETFIRFQDPEYLLFGNAPRLFRPFSDLPEAKLKSILKGKAKKGDDPYYAVRGFGRLYEFSSKQPIVLFPTSHCYFASDPGKLFVDHKIYFLLDYQGKELTPYFGASFFNPQQTEFNVEQVGRLMLDRLGKGYKAFDIRKKTVVFFSRSKPQDFDLEGDPKNLCSQRKANNVVGVVRRDPNRPNYPASLIVANLGNACSFGDKLGRRLLTK